MQKKTDRRVRKTKSQLKTGLAQLMREKSIREITVKEREYFIHGQTDEQGNVLIPGCVRNGIDEQSANKIFDYATAAGNDKVAFNKFKATPHKWQNSHRRTCIL